MSDIDSVSLTASGSGKSEAEVAFELLNKLKGQGVWGERNIGAILDMYAECLDAAKGLRAYEGQKRIEAPITKLNKEPVLQQPVSQAPVSPQPQMLQAAPPAAAPRPQAVPQPQVQPVRAPQPAPVQSYKPAG